MKKITTAQEQFNQRQEEVKDARKELVVRINAKETRKAPNGANPYDKEFEIHYRQDNNIVRKDRSGIMKIGVDSATAHLRHVVMDVLGKRSEYHYNPTGEPMCLTENPCYREALMVKTFVYSHITTNSPIRFVFDNLSGVGHFESTWY